MPQSFPHENGFGPLRFLRTYTDDIHGIPVSEDRAIRDHMGRLVDINDIDQPDRDELMRGWSIRGEEEPIDP